jgi:hypothetical protein
VKIFFFCIALLLAIVGVSWMLKSSTPGPMRDTDRVPPATVKKAVEKALNDPQFLSEAQDRYDQVVITEVRTNDEGSLYKVYLDFYLKDKVIGHGDDTLKRDEFGVWTLNNFFGAKLDLKEDQ